MKTMRDHWKMMSLLAVLAVAMPVSGQSSNVLEQAKTLFGEKKYAECAAVLKDSLAKNPSQEALLLAMRAEYFAGNPLTANHHASELLRLTKNQDMPLMFEAAEIADAAGDRNLARSRYYTYISSKEASGARKTKAIQYLKSFGVYPEATRMFAKDIGHEISWTGIDGRLDQLFKTADVTGIAQEVLFDTEVYYDDLDAIERMLNRLWRDRDRMGQDQTAIVEALASSKFKDGANLWPLADYIKWYTDRAKLDAVKRFRIASSIVESSNQVIPRNDMYLDVARDYIASRQTPASKSAAAKEIFGHAKQFSRTKNYDQLNGYINLITSNPEPFSFVTPKQLGSLVRALNKLVNNDSVERNIAPTIDQAIRGFYKTDKTASAEFMREAAIALNGNQMSELVRLAPDKNDPKSDDSNIAKFVNAVPDGFGREYREMLILDALSISKNRNRLVRAARNTIKTSRYDGTWLANVLLGAGLKGDVLAKIVLEGAEPAGYSPALEALVKRLESNAEVSGAPQFATLKAIVSSKKAGTDSVLNAAAKTVTAFDSKNAGEIEKSLATLASAFKGKIPAVERSADSIQALAAFRAANQEINSYIGNNKDLIKKAVDRWGGRFETAGTLPDVLAQRAFNADGNAGRKGGIYYDLLKQMSKTVASSKDYRWLHAMDQVSQTGKPNTDESIMEPLYSIQPWHSANYIANSAGNWSKDFYYKQIESFLNSPGEKSWSALNLIRESIRNSRHKESIPDSTTAALFKAYDEEGKSRQQQMIHWDRGEAWNVQNIDGWKRLGQYAKILEKRTPIQQLAALNVLFDARGDAANEEVFLSLKPIFDNMMDAKPSAFKGHWVSSRLLWFLGNTSNNKNFKPEVSASAKNIYDKMRQMIFNGYLDPGKDAAVAETLAYALPEIVESKDNIRISRALSTISGLLSNENNNWRGFKTIERVEGSTKEVPDQIRYAFYSVITQGANPFNQEAKTKYAMLMSQLAKDAPGVIPVPPNDPTYPLFLANKLRKEGNMLQAWAQVRERIPLLTSRWKELMDFEFVAWVLDNARKQKLYKEALDLAQTMWLDEQRMAPEEASLLGMLKGDIYRDMKNFPAARIEYESLNNIPRYAKTQSGRLAKFRLVELLLLTEDFQTARLMLERQVDSRAVEDQSEAYYLLARLEASSKEWDEANKNLQEVFKRDINHTEARLLEAEIQLLKRQLTGDEIPIGSQVEASIVVPGKNLTLSIQDANLGIVRGSNALPVIVWTSHGKDKERVDLMPQARQKNTFTASIPTALGKAKPGNFVLELNGSDEIFYQIDPVFQKDNGLDFAPHTMTVKSEAKLFASPFQIASEQDQDIMALQNSLEMLTGRASARSGGQVRPGNSFFVRVVDPDMSLDPNKRNTVTVNITCSSGDELNGFELIETGEATGVFDGKVPTGIPFPCARASDAPEDVDVNAVINSTKTGGWTSMPNEPGKDKTKWLEVDTMTACDFKEAVMTMPDPKQIKTLRLVGILDQEEEPLCSFPTEDMKNLKGGLNVQYVTSQKAMSEKDFYATLAKSKPNPVNVRRPEVYRDLIPALRDKDGWVATDMSGAFFLPEEREIEFKFLQSEDPSQFATLYVDGRELISGRMNSIGLMKTAALTLDKGVHTIRIFTTDSKKSSGLQLGMALADGSHQLLPAEWFDVKKNPDLLDYLKPKGTITQNKTGYSVRFEKPQRFRKLKWIFEEYSGNVITVDSISAKDAKGEKILPVEQDLTSGKENSTLEIAAGDTITVRYEDIKNLNPNKLFLTSNLSSSFADGDISFAFEEITVDEDGRMKSQLIPAIRVQKGDVVMVQVSDPDANVSEERDIVKIEIVTSSGEKLELNLLEDAINHGVFREAIKLGDETDSSTNSIKLNKGDELTARYLDQENNKPGIPFYRTATVVNADGMKPVLTLFTTRITQIEDRSPAALARVKMMQNKGDKRKDIKLYRDQIVAAPVPRIGKKKADDTVTTDAEGNPIDPVDANALLVNSKAPLLLQVNYPEKAKHTSSKLILDILTQTEINAAAQEGREQAPLQLSLTLSTVAAVARTKGYPLIMEGEGVTADTSVMKDGIFSGVVRLQLGAANDEILDTIATNDTFDLLATNSTKSDAFKVPTVIVSGSDKIYVSLYNDEGETLFRDAVQLRSDGEIGLFDKAYLTENKAVHIGQSFYVRVYDPDRDMSDERDSIEVDVTAGTGDAVKLVLSETLPHSGIFSNSLKTELKPRPLAGETEPKKLDPNTIWTNFGDKLEFTYVDTIPLSKDASNNHKVLGEVVIGSDAELAVFSKRFKDPEMAVKTNFLMAEALFEMAKGHRAMSKASPNGKDEKKEEQAKTDIARGKRVLEEALRDYPDTSLKPQGEYLLAHLSHQMEDYSDAIGKYSAVMGKYPDTEYAIKSQFQKAICLMKLKQSMAACEEFVKITYMYPDNKLAVDARVHLGNYYYGEKRFDSAREIFWKFALTNPEHASAPLSILLAGRSAIQHEEKMTEEAAKLKKVYITDYTKAIRIYQDLLDKFPEARPDVRAEGMFYLGHAYQRQKGPKSEALAYQTWQNLIWTYPETQWGKRARGLLASIKK